MIKRGTDRLELIASRCEPQRSPFLCHTESEQVAVVSCVPTPLGEVFSWPASGHSGAASPSTLPALVLSSHLGRGSTQLVISNAPFFSLPHFLFLPAGFLPRFCEFSFPSFPFPYPRPPPFLVRFPLIIYSGACSVLRT